ncbi:hypothetical protein ACIQ7D_17755 [Streptomyces sp. NPDC096310]|uniref:hypothetical protein n=1 Tax=Streptomyces sp. NPDC096310 TaxID=3366082 RepID=UPI003819DF78
MTNTPLTPRAALIRLRQYGERTSTWSTATYNGGTEKALHEIALTLAAEVERLEADRDAFRDQRNGVFATTEQLHARVDEKDQARLQAENETRTLTREAERLKARIAELETPAPAVEIPVWLGTPVVRPHCTCEQTHCNTCHFDMYDPPLPEVTP